MTPTTYLTSVIKSMPRRCQAVIDAKMYAKSTDRIIDNIISSDNVGKAKISANRLNGFGNRMDLAHFSLLKWFGCYSKALCFEQEGNKK